MLLYGLFISICMNIASEYHVGLGVTLVSKLGEFTTSVYTSGLHLVNPSLEHREVPAGSEK